MEHTLEEELAEYKVINGSNSRKHTISPGIRDNRNNGTVGDFLVEHIKPSSNVAIVSAFFTIYAYKKLQSQFDSIRQLQIMLKFTNMLKLQMQKTLSILFSFNHISCYCGITENVEYRIQ